MSEQPQEPLSEARLAELRQMADDAGHSYAEISESYGWYMQMSELLRWIW